MEIKEILDRQQKIRDLEDAGKMDPSTAQVAGVCFWLSEIALQLARINQGNGAK